MNIKPDKNQAIKAAVQLTPQYAEWISCLQKDNSKIFPDAEIVNIQNNVGKYVLMYDDERKIGRSLFLTLLGKEGWEELNTELENASDAEKQEWLDDMANPNNNELAELFDSIEIPSTPEGWRLAREAAEKLPEDVREEAKKQGTYFWCFVFSSFFNTLSLMVHGARLTTLVPNAIAGDDEAFLKAIQIDRMLLIHHPYFRDRKHRAQYERDTTMLSKIAYRESNSPLRGKIQFPALYMLFGILESYMWLNDLKHKEILDVCDKANLDRYQNRIEDVGYLTKRLAEYRRYQKTGGVSMYSN